jgi:DNA-binding NarL/FixJ family response regulator
LLSMVVVPGPRSGVSGTSDLSSSPGPGVLVIDKHPLFRDAMETLLSAPPIGARVQVVSDSQSGLESAKRGGIQAVFCDIRVAPISVLELVKELAALDPPVPLIVLGDREDQELMTTALHASVAGLFTKDCSLDEFQVGVRAVLSGHRAVGANLMGLVLDRLGGSPREGRRPSNQLSPTELAILTQIGHARSIPAIAASRGISHKTVRNHLASIYRKLDLSSRTEAMLCAARMGLTAD